MTNYALPAHIGADEVTIRMVNANAVPQSPFTGATQVLEYPKKRWAADINLPPMDHADARLWISFLAKLNGRVNTFNMGDPAGATPQGTAGGVPRINGAGQTGKYLTIDGATASQTDWLKEGDYIQLGTGAASRLFMVTGDVSTNASGGAEISLWPKITTAPTDNHLVTVSAAKGTWRMISDVAAFNIRAAQNYGISFSAESVI